MTREQAWNLLTQYNKQPFHLKHAVTLEGVMRYFAIELGHADEADRWAMVGLLHDLDFEEFPQAHCIKQQQLMKEAGIDDVIIRATASHGWPHAVDIEPVSDMEKILYATDELTGLIGAVALLRPSKSVQDMTLKSVKKKFKTPTFAAGCSRDVIQKGADLLDWTLNDLISKTILAMRTCEKTANQFNT
ncbi:MAG: hydrolase [Candidatus Fimivivens sp.]